MTRTERTIIKHWRSIAVLCAIVALFGIVWALWHRMDDADRRYAAAITEADKRGDAVSTLVGDVRALRDQIKAYGDVPVAPDPEDAVEDLPDRTEVPVPIPGPQGLPGKDGQDGADSTVPGPQGPAGQDGADSTVPGPQGPAGPAGQDGADSTVPGPQGPAGPAGPAGQTCPDGYSLQTPYWDHDALVCRRNPAPDQDPGGLPLSPASAVLPPDRRWTVVGVQPVMLSL